MSFFRRGSALDAVAWGMFCASSWAWCIGLFLPTLLRRLLGWEGFLAFAIPNVVGCTAFGFVLDARSSRRLRREHRPAMLGFSAVTIAYQLLLAGWTGSVLLGDRVGSWTGAAIGLAAVGLLAAALQGARERWWPLLAIAAWILSAGSLLAALPEAPTTIEPELPLAAVWGLLPALLLGFLLCPYLDLTFHRALRQGPRRSTFLVFGLTFAALIVLVAFLADPAAPMGLDWTPLVAAQLWVQLGFTAGAHWREILVRDRTRAGRPRGVRRLVIVALLAGVVLGSPLIAGEANYLRMLGWYGLVFPAYVLLAMVGEGRRPSSSTWVLLAVLCLLSLPFYEQGLGSRSFGWMAVPAPVLLAAAWWLRRRRSNHPRLALG